MEAALYGIYDATEALLKTKKSPEEVNKTFSVQVKGHIIYPDKSTHPDKKFDRLVKISTFADSAVRGECGIGGCFVKGSVSQTRYLEAKNQLKNEGYYIEKFENATVMVTSINYNPSSSDEAHKKLAMVRTYETDIYREIKDPNYV